MWASCPVLRFKPGSADIEFLSWENFEKDLDLFFNKLKMPYAVCRVFRIGGAHHLIGTQYGKKEDIFSKIWTARYKKMAGIMREYEKRKGIKGKIIYELYDEPYDKDYDKLAGCAKILRSVYPDIKLTFWSGRGIIPGLLKDIDVWTVSNMSFSSSLSAQLQKQGKQVWIYNPVQWTDLSMPMGSSRRLFWYLWTKKVNGLFFWNISAWKEWGGRYSRPNRDSTFVYPGKYGPINTLRWENFRDGLEDYEYLSLLSQAVNNTKSGKANKKDKIAAAEAENFIKEINRTDFRAIDSMADLIRFREGLAIRIEKLKKYLPVEKKGAKFIMDKKAGVIGNIVLRLSPKDFPKLNREGKRSSRIIKISKNDRAVKLSSRLFSFDLSGSPEKRIIELEFEVQGTAEIMPVLFVRFAGLVKPDSCLKPVKISTGKCKKMSFRFQIASRGKGNIQLKLIFNITGSKSLEISNATLKVKE
jgi:hypothetical protein